MAKIRPKLERPNDVAVYTKLSSKPASVKKLAEATGLTEAQVNASLYYMRKVGHAHSERILDEETGRSPLMHVKQTEGRAQGQRGLTQHPDRGGKKAKARRTPKDLPLVERMRTAISNAVDAVGELEALLIEAERDLSLLAQIRSTL